MLCPMTLGRSYKEPECWSSPAGGWGRKIQNLTIALFVVMRRTTLLVWFSRPPKEVNPLLSQGGCKFDLLRGLFGVFKKIPHNSLRSSSLPRRSSFILLYYSTMKLYSLYLLLPLFLPSVLAKNDFSQPCFNGLCSFDVEQTETSMGGTVVLVCSLDNLNQLLWFITDMFFCFSRDLPMLFQISPLPQAGRYWTAPRQPPGRPLGSCAPGTQQTAITCSTMAPRTQLFASHRM